MDMGKNKLQNFIRYLWILILIFNCSPKINASLKSILPFSLNLQSGTLSNAKELKKFQFLKLSPPVTANISGNNITANLASSVSLTNLVTSFEFTGKEVLVNNAKQENNSTINDFTNEVTYTVVAEDSSKIDYKVKLINTGFNILGSSGSINITGLSASDTSLEMFYDTNGNSFQSFANNTKIGTILPTNTSFALRFKTQPTGKICALSGGSVSGVLSSDNNFTINCVAGFLVGGRIVSRLSTFTIAANTGDVTTLAGSLPPTVLAGTTNGSAGVARLNSPIGVSTNGIDLFIADAGNHCIRKYEIATGNVTTIAGICGVMGTADGVGAFARFNNPVQVSTDGTNLFVCDRGNNTIRKINITSGTVITLVGLAGSAGDLDGIGTAARIDYPNGITTDGNYLYISDRNNHKIKRVHLASLAVVTIAGTGAASSIDNTFGTSATLNQPCDSVAVNNNLYLVECGGNVVRKINLSGTFPISTVAGNGVAATIDGLGNLASLNNPHGIETDGSNLFVSEFLGSTIRRVSISNFSVVTIAGGTAGYADGIGTVARLNNPGGVTSDGNFLYFVDGSNHSIRRMNNPPD
jgi:hypothetical protein